MDTIFKYVNNVFEGLNNTIIKNQIEEYFLNSSSTIEHFKKDKKPKKTDDKPKAAKTPKAPKKPKAKVYHHKAGSAKSEYTEDFKNNKKPKKTDDEPKPKSAKTPKAPKAPKTPKAAKAKVYHHKAGADKSKYTEDFTNSENKIYIMLPKNSFKNSVDILIHK